MTTLQEIEAASNRLQVAEKRQLLIHLARQLSLGDVPLPEPRRFSKLTLQSWLERDREDMEHVRSAS